MAVITSADMTQSCSPIQLNLSRAGQHPLAKSQLGGLVYIYPCSTTENPQALPDLSRAPPCNAVGVTCNVLPPVLPHPVFYHTLRYYYPDTSNHYCLVMCICESIFINFDILSKLYI